jgi:hemolysin III
MKTPLITYSREEELANTISHVVGFVVALFGLVFMFIQANSQLSFWGNVGVWVYGVSLLTAFATSSLYHGTIDGRLKLFYKKLDHISIYLLISGSYAVIIFNRLMNADGYVFLTALYGMTLVGVWFKARYVHRFKVFSTVIYIIMGYLIFVNPTVFFDVLERNTIVLLAVSGLFYTIGAGFYLWKSKKWTHFTWHVFVLIAASLHFLAVYRELIS